MSDIWYWSDYIIVDNQLAHIKSQLFKKDPGISELSIEESLDLKVLVKWREAVELQDINTRSIIIYSPGRDTQAMRAFHPAPGVFLLLAKGLFCVTFYTENRSVGACWMRGERLWPSLAGDRATFCMLYYIQLLKSLMQWSNYNGSQSNIRHIRFGVIWIVGFPWLFTWPKIVREKGHWVCAVNSLPWPCSSPSETEETRILSCEAAPGRIDECAGRKR